MALISSVLDALFCWSVLLGPGKKPDCTAANQVIQILELIMPKILGISMFFVILCAYTCNSQVVYQMTEPRGRALIVSNDFNQTRAGSEHDYQNMKRMLDKLGFVTVGSHENYTAAVSI